MTVIIPGHDIANLITAQFPEAVVEFDSQAAVIKNECLLKVAHYLKNSPDISLDYLTDLTAVDYRDFFEVIYRLSSLEQNKILTLKVRCYGRENLQVPSVTGLWKGADFMEREIFDLLGISFIGHPNLKRIFLWEGFTGHPLRKDYLQEVNEK